MGAVMWIEVLSRHGEVAARERIEAPEARICRAVHNDVVIDDVHVAPHHLRIYRGEDGELVAEDLGTLNGLFPEHGANPVPSLSLAREPGIRIGRTTLRVHDSAHPVAAEKLLTPPRAHSRWAVGLGVTLLLTLLLLQWLALTAEASASLVLLPLFGLAAYTLLLPMTGVIVRSAAAGSKPTPTLAGMAMAAPLGLSTRRALTGAGVTFASSTGSARRSG